jgi:hypothetical protein
MQTVDQTSSSPNKQVRSLFAAGNLLVMVLIYAASAAASLLLLLLIARAIGLLDN